MNNLTNAEPEPISPRLENGKTSEAQSTHTPEPWELEGPNFIRTGCKHDESCEECPLEMTGYGVRHQRTEDDNVWIADIFGEHVGVPIEEAHANARLIVAAPALYEAVQHALAIEDSVTQGQEKELREGYRQLLVDALALVKGAE